jgi:hypothetical protein
MAPVGAEASVNLLAAPLARVLRPILAARQPTPPVAAIATALEAISRVAAPGEHAQAPRDNGPPLRRPATHNCLDGACPRRQGNAQVGTKGRRGLLRVALAPGRA